jgi:uncharacterized Zn-finger protein
VFGSKPGLLEHEKLHKKQLAVEEAKPYSCHLCPRRFARNGKLSAHIKTHLQVGPMMVTAVIHTLLKSFPKL